MTDHWVKCNHDKHFTEFYHKLYDTSLLRKWIPVPEGFTKKPSYGKGSKVFTRIKERYDGPPMAVDCSEDKTCAFSNLSDFCYFTAETRNKQVEDVGAMFPKYFTDHNGNVNVRVCTPFNVGIRILHYKGKYCLHKIKDRAFDIFSGKAREGMNDGYMVSVQSTARDAYSHMI
eukprot:9581470-Ditylum_brightwellii.AAC.1